MPKRLLAAACGACLLAASLASHAQDIVVKIGHVAPSSGMNAQYGAESRKGAALAVNELNDKAVSIGGRRARFELLDEDDAGDPKQAAAAAQKLVDAKVNGVVGSLGSSTSLVMAKVLNDAGIPQISPWATAPALTRSGYKMVFRLAADDLRVGEALGLHAAKVLGVRNVAIISDGRPFSEATAGAFASAVQLSPGVKLMSRDTVSDKTTDFSKQAGQWKGTNKPDLVFFAGDASQAVALLRQMNDVDASTIFMGSEAACAAKLPEFAAGGARRRTVYCGTSKVPGFETPRSNSYDAVKLLAAAMVRAKSAEPLKYLPELAKTAGFKGATGTISFDAKGDRKDAPVSLFGVDRDKLKLIGVAGASPGTDGGCPVCYDDQVCCTDKDNKKVCKDKKCDA